MISKQLRRFAKRYDWKKHTDNDGEIIVFGDFNGFLFTAIEGQGFKAFFTPVAGINSQALENLKTWLEDNQKILKMKNYELADNFLCVRLKEDWLPTSVEKMENFLIRLTGILSELKLPEKACAICGDIAEKKGLYVGLFCHLHPECQSKPGIDFTLGTAATTNNTQTDVPGAPKSEMISKLAGAMETYRQPLIETVVEICRIPSIKSPAEADAPYGPNTAEALQTFLDISSRLGFHTVNLDNRAGYIEWGNGDHMVAALCHLDVVPAGPGWNNEPFNPREINGRLTGRGTVDDKGPATAVLYAMKALKDESFMPNHRLRLIVGLDEENGSDCMSYYSKHEELPSAGFTADASFPVIHAEKGIVQLTLSMDEKQDDSDILQLISANGGDAANVVAGSFAAELSDREPLVINGRQAHASRPQDGENAIIKGIYRVQRELHAASSHHPFVSAFTLLFPPDNPGKIIDFDLNDQYGDLTANPGILELNANGASLTIDIRYPVTCSFETDVKKPLEKLANQFGFNCSWGMHLEPLFIDQNSELVKTINSVYTTMTETDADPQAIGGGTYARAIPNIVAFGPTFPGDLDICHQADESIETDRLLAASAIYKETLRALAQR